MVGTQTENPAAYADKVADMIIPDVLTYKVGTKAAYAVENLNGRKLTDDGMDVVLTLFSGKPMTDNANTMEGRYQSSFPYVVPGK